MANAVEIQVLVAYRPFARILRLYNPANFNTTGKSTRFRNISKAIGFAILLMSLSLIMVSGYRFCVDQNFNVMDISLAMPIILCAFQMVLTYFSLMLENHELGKIVERLQVTIDKREYCT